MRKPTAAAPSPIATIVSPFFPQLRRITIVNGSGPWCGSRPRGSIRGGGRDHADVLHGRVHAGRSHEAVTPATSTAWRTPPPAGSPWAGRPGPAEPARD